MLFLGGMMAAILGLSLGAAPKGEKAPKAALDQPTAADPKDDATNPDATTNPDENLPTIDVLQGLRTGQLSASAEGRGDGKVTLALTNRSKTKLRVVLPPGLVVSGATGQFGGGMGMMGGGMGGMGGGMMGGMGGMGGGMMGGRGMLGGGTLPALMGMMMLGRLIMQFCGDRESWDQRSLMMGMMMGGMGGMGGGMMGGMGGGMMGGMGGMRGMVGMGWFGSVPPTGCLETTLEPKQSRHLPTPIVSLNGPGADMQPLVPAKGEVLRVSGIDQWTDDTRARAALKGLAEAKAPATVAQMVLWYVISGASWDDIGRLSQGWGNAQELALARRFVAELEKGGTLGGRLQTDPGPLYWEIKAEGEHARTLAENLRAFWSKCPVLGLSAREGIDKAPKGPALACRMTLSDTSAEITFSASHPSGTEWVGVGRFRIKLSDLEVRPDDAAKDTPELKAKRESARLGELAAEGMLARLVRVQLAHGPRVKGKPGYQIKIINESPMILNGLAVTGIKSKEQEMPSILAGLSVPPSKTLKVPASAELVERLRLKQGVRVMATDLSGL